jgi:Ca2+-binding RTX toxin-like protein
VSFDGLLYQPEPNFFGVDIFTYRPMDSQGAQGGHVIVSIAVSAVNDPPTLAAIGDLSIPEDAGTQTANLSGITAGPGEVENLTVTATSDNLALIPNPTVAYTNLDSTGILSFAPVANASGTAIITVTVSDEAGTAVRQFTVTVTPVNDPPTTTGLPAASLLEDGPANISLTGGFADIEDGAAGLTYAVVGSTNPGLFSTVSISGGSLQLTPAANASGSAILTIQAADSGGVSVQTALAVTVAPVNDAPSFTPGANQTVTAGTGPRSVVGWATNLSPGPAGEASQGLSFEVTTSNPGLFVVLPAIDPATGTLTFIPEASAAGTATVTAVLRDTGGTANGGVDSFTRTFTITVNPNGLPTTRGVRMIGGELVITGTDAADVISVSRRGKGVRVNATLGGASFNGSFNGVVRVRVDAKGGDDTIDFSNSLPVPTWTDAGAGNDSVAGSDEVDEIYLGIGDDTATGGAGNDFIAGGTGKDLIDGGSENDAIYGGDGDDFVIGGPGVDGLFGLSGNDLLVGASATVRNTNDSLRQILTDWDPSRPGVYDELRARILIADDATGDRLRGDAGTDWFLALLPPDTIDDREGGEQLN